MPDSPSLKGHLLIAAPSLLDPNFHRSVVLILEHTAEGALGVVLNRPSGVSAADAVPDLSEVVEEHDEVFVGGPVQPQAVIALAEFSEPLNDDSSLVGPIAPIDMGEDIDEMLDGVARVRLFAGYAGWSEGQLDGELDEEAWFTEPAPARRRVLRRQRHPLEPGAGAEGRPLPVGGLDARGPQPQLMCSK